MIYGLTDSHNPITRWLYRALSDHFYRYAAEHLEQKAEHDAHVREAYWPKPEQAETENWLRYT